MKEITLKEAYEILKDAEAVLVENREDVFSSKLQEISFYEEEMKIEESQIEICGKERGEECECYPHTFATIGDQNDDYLNFPSQHNRKVKITPDGGMLLNDWDGISTKIKILKIQNL